MHLGEFPALHRGAAGRPHVAGEGADFAVDRITGGCLGGGKEGGLYQRGGLPRPALRAASPACAVRSQPNVPPCPPCAMPAHRRAEQGDSSGAGAAAVPAHAAGAARPAAPGAA